MDVDAVSDYLGQVNETRSITSAYARRCVDEINRVGAVSDLWEDYEAEEDEAGPGRAWAGNLNFSVLLF